MKPQPTIKEVGIQMSRALKALLELPSSELEEEIKYQMAKDYQNWLLKGHQWLKEQTGYYIQKHPQSEEFYSIVTPSNGTCYVGQYSDCLSQLISISQQL